MSPGASRSAYGTHEGEQRTVTGHEIGLADGGDLAARHAGHGHRPQPPRYAAEVQVKWCVPSRSSTIVSLEVVAHGAGLGDASSDACAWSAAAARVVSVLTAALTARGPRRQLAAPARLCCRGPCPGSAHAAATRDGVEQLMTSSTMTTICSGSLRSRTLRFTATEGGRVEHTHGHRLFAAATLDDAELDLPPLRTASAGTASRARRRHRPRWGRRWRRSRNPCRHRRDFTLPVGTEHLLVACRRGRPIGRPTSRLTARGYAARPVSVLAPYRESGGTLSVPDGRLADRERCRAEGLLAGLACPLTTVGSLAAVDDRHHHLGSGHGPAFTIVLTEVRHVSLDTAGVLMGLIAVAAFVITGPSGALTDRIGGRRVVIAATTLAIAACSWARRALVPRRGPRRGRRLGHALGRLGNTFIATVVSRPADSSSGSVPCPGQPGDRPVAV